MNAMYQVTIFETGESTESWTLRAASREAAIDECIAHHFGPWATWEFVISEGGMQTGERRVKWDGFNGEHVSLVRIQAMEVSDS